MTEFVECIEWIDSFTPLAGVVWIDKDDITDEVMAPSRCISVGFIIRETDEVVMIAAHNSAHQVSGALCIPKSVIIKRSEVRI